MNGRLTLSLRSGANSSDDADMSSIPIGSFSLGNAPTDRGRALPVGALARRDRNALR